MALGQNSTQTIVLNNKSTTTVSKVVELVVVDTRLIADNDDINPGVNTKNTYPY